MAEDGIILMIPNGGNDRRFTGGNMMRKLTAILVLALAIAGGWATSVMAATIFDVEVLVGWDPAATTCLGSGTNDCIQFSGVGGFAGTATEMGWDFSPDATGGAHSFLRIGALDAISGGAFLGTDTTTITSGQTIVSATAQHENNAIPAEDDELFNTVLPTLLTLTNPDGDIVFQAFIPIPINFEETFNEDTAAECAGPNPIGTACDDVFTFPELNTTTQFTDPDTGISYLINVRGLFFDAAGTLFACEDPVAGISSCFTGENLISDRFVVISLTQIPAPATLLLLGLGLLGIGAAGWKRR
jgi:hypothetical protein